MEYGEVVEVALDAIGKQAGLILVLEGTVWEAYPERFFAHKLTAVARLHGSVSERVKRDFDLRDVSDLALMSPDIESTTIPEEQEVELNRISRLLLAHADQTSDPLVERALRAAQAKVMEAEVAHAKQRKDEDGSVHHRPGPSYAGVFGAVTAPRVPYVAAGADAGIADRTNPSVRGGGPAID